jgi:integrase
MPVIKVTQKNVDKLKAPSGTGSQLLYWDRELKGFGVLVSGKTNTITYVVQKAINGNTRRITIGQTNVLDAAKARDKAEQVLADLTLGNDPKAAKRGIPTLEDALKQYLDACKSDLSTNTVKSYNTLIKRHLEGWLKKPLSTITVDMVQERHRELGEKVGPPTANAAMRTLRLLWNFVLENRPAVGPNPVRLKKRWHKVAARTRLVRSDQLPEFFKAVNALENKIHRDYLLMLLFTGMRRRECASLRWDHVDLGNKALRVPAANTKSGTKLDLPLTDFLLNMLVARRALGNGDFVFPSNSKSGHLEEPKFALNLVKEATGIAVSPHDLRRSFATVAASCNISGLVQTVLVNHSPGKSVHGDYVLPTVDELREPAQIVCDRLKALCGIEKVVGKSVKRLR